MTVMGFSKTTKSSRKGDKDGNKMGYTKTANIVTSTPESIWRIVLGRPSDAYTTMISEYFKNFCKREY